MTGTRWLRWTGWMLCALLVASCASGPVRRVSEPSARIQQLSVQADGSWQVQLRIENFSSIPMRFERLRLDVEVDGSAAGTLEAAPALTVGPESADTTALTLSPSVAAKLAVADALAGRRSVHYTLAGNVAAVPEDEREREFTIERRSALSPAPGLPGVLR